VNDPRTFGAALRRERERRGITLDTIAEQTKVSAALLDGLERGDLTRWPAGIFRRAFVRGYADAVGLDSRTVLEAFLRIYPDEGAPAQAPAHVVAAAFGQAQPLRLTLADDDKLRTVLSRSRVVGAAIDLLAPTVTAAVVAALVTPSAGWATLGCVAIGYHALGAIALGTTPGLWAAMSLLNRVKRADAPAVPVTVEPIGAVTEGESRDEPARAPAEILFHQRRRNRHANRPDRYPRRAGDSRAARR
jgi:transcriptional regulator with XRE-family HTH domain